MGATIPVAFGQTRCYVLIDTGAMKSCMSQTFYQQLMLPTMRNIYTYQVKSATGSNLCPMGITGCEFKIGDRGYKTDFVVCKNLTRPCILGIDFLRKHNIFAGWTAEGKFKLISQQEFLVESLEVLMDGPMIYNKQGITVPGRKLAIIKVTRPSHVHYSRLTPKLKFLYQERATQERTTNTPKQFGKLYWYSVTVSVQPQLSLNLCIQCIL